MDYLFSALLTGTGATLVMDGWGVARTRILGGRAPDYGLVGRWLAYMPRGRFRHRPISASSPVRGERLIGWSAHYLIGIAFASVLLAVWGLEWARQPTIGPALIVGLGSVAAPVLLMQPAMGTGFRFQSFITHAVFGLGLYLAAWVASVLNIF
jgi:hypothetical protein